MPWKLCSCLRVEVENVRELDFNHHSLKEVPAAVFAHERTLEKLSLESNQLVELPRALFHCHGLRVLNLSDNGILTMPPAIASLINLQHLNLSRNSLNDIPDNIKCCKLLTHLNVGVNPLEKLPEGFTQLITLEELFLNDTCLEYLPANFGRLAKLRILDLRENRLNTLPRSIARLANLHVIDIGHNEFSDLPEVVGNLPELTELWADGNKIRSIPPFIGNLENLKHIDMSSNNVQWVAPEIQRCQRLNFLVLACNELQVLPEEVGYLKSLEMLKADDNELRELPVSIGRLSNLEELVVSQNIIKEIPPTIGLLRKIRIINADDNLLTELPSELCSCSSLRILSVRGNKLMSLPAEIGHLGSARVINVSDNLLRNLPVSVLNLTQLNALWLSTNQTTPLTTLQQDVDPRTGQTVCVNFMFPQMEHARRNKKRTEHGDRESSLPVERSSRPHIRFADTTDVRSSRLTRAPTPYPKELRSMAKHARILTTRPLYQPDRRDQVDYDDEDDDLGDEEASNPLLGEMASVSDTRAVNVKTASVLRRGGEGSETAAFSSDPGLSLDSYERPVSGELVMHHQLATCSYSQTVYEKPAMGELSPVGTGMYSARQRESMSNEVQETDGRNYTVTSVHSLPTVANGKKDDGEGRPLMSASVPDTSSPDSRQNGSATPTSDGMYGEKVPPPYHIAALQSKHAAKFSEECFDLRTTYGHVGVNLPDSRANYKFSPMYPMTEISKAPLSPPFDAQTSANKPAPVHGMERVVRLSDSFNLQNLSLDPEDLSRIQEQEEVADAEMSVHSAAEVSPSLARHQLYTSNGNTGEQELSISPGIRCRIPVPKEQAVRISPKPQSAAGKERLPSTPHSGKPVTKIPSFRDSKSPTPRPAQGAVASRIRQPVFHSATTTSQSSAPRSDTKGSAVEGGNRNSSPEVNYVPDMKNANLDHSNGGHSPKIPVCGDTPSPKNNGNKSKIPALTGKNSPSWVFGQHRNPTVFPVTVVKNPGLGFSIAGGANAEFPGIFINKVHPGGPVSGFLKSGDKILEVDGIDFLKLEHDQAVGILKQTKNVVQMMISRLK